MTRDRSRLIVFAIAAAIAAWLLWKVFQPFMAPLAWAILVVTATFPAYRWVRRGIRRDGLAAVAMTLLVLFGLILPVTVLALTLAKEAAGAVAWFEEHTEAGRMQEYFEQATELPAISSLLDRLGVDPRDLPRMALDGLKRFGAAIAAQTTVVVKSVFLFVAEFVMFLMALYYLFKDGEGMLRRARALVPVFPGELDVFLSRFKAVVKATFLGGLLVALAQGAVAGVIYWILGIPSPLLWGALTALAALIPVAGSPLVWGPWVIVLFVQGEIWRSVVLAALGTGVVGVLDNLLRPYLISNQTRVHPILLLFGILGGIAAFGTLGLAIGPLAVSFGITLLEVAAFRTSPPVPRSPDVPPTEAPPQAPATGG